MTPERFETLKKVLAHRQMDLTVVMDGVHKPHNFNAIVRTCDAVGVHQAHFISVAGGYKPFANTAKGSQKYVQATEHESFEQVAAKLKGEGMQLLAAHLSDQAVDYRSVDYTRPTALVMGEELKGISEQTANSVDQHVIVPMQGMVESLNVSVACAVILFEAQRQRLAAGMYAQRSMSDELYRSTLFEWCWPKIARLCQRQGRPYPDLDEVGEFKSF